MFAVTPGQCVQKEQQITLHADVNVSGGVVQLCEKPLQDVLRVSSDGAKGCFAVYSEAVALTRVVFLAAEGRSGGWVYYSS